jgi:hypothetical protein
MSDYSVFEKWAEAQPKMSKKRQRRITKKAMRIAARILKQITSQYMSKRD